jgi:hypothetical protein
MLIEGMKPEDLVVKAANLLFTNSCFSVTSFPFLSVYVFKIVCALATLHKSKTVIPINFSKGIIYFLK